MTVVDTEVAGVLRKAFDVLDTFGPTRPTLSLSDITRRSGLPKTTAHRILQQMLSVGAVDRVGHQRYRVGTRVFALSARSREATVREVALPHLTDLNRRYGHTLHLTTLCDTDVLYLEKLQNRATAATPSAVGVRLPAHCTAAGKVLLAWQPWSFLIGLRERELVARTTASMTSTEQLFKSFSTIRERGFAVDNEEAMVGLRCTAVPVKVAGDAVAAISIAHSSATKLPKDGHLALQETAAQITRGLTRIPGYLGILQVEETWS